MTEQSHAPSTTQCPACGARPEDGWPGFFRCGSAETIPGSGVIVQSRHCAWEEASHLRATIASLRTRVAELEAALAASVPREVAVELLAACKATLNAIDSFPSGAAKHKPLGSPRGGIATMLRAAIARAEAEAKEAKP